MDSGNTVGKVKSFNICGGKKQLSKKELEKHKKEQEEKDAAKVYQEFVETFEKPPTVGRLFVLGSVMNSGHEEDKDSLKVYKPNKLQELEEKVKRNDNYHHNEPSVTPPKMEKLGKKKEKKKSNLELFKEELRQIQEEREERHRLKTLMVKEEIKEIEFPTKSVPLFPDDCRTSSSTATMSSYGSFDTGDPNTTNIYLGNINPKMSEKELMQVFGVYGPLASVKIMWPRSEEERARNRNCGFVAYMSRKDGERALKALNGKEIQGYEMKLGWGKAVPIPPHPIYIPPKLMELTMPPPPSGLPFNAQPDPSDLDKLPPPGVAYPMLTPRDRKNFEKILANATVKVVVPTDRPLLNLIHRMTEFVVKEGPMFEAMIMNREINNPLFRFLFDNQSPAHIYYRWRLYSALQGEHPNKWRTEEFRLFKGGSKWKPPPLNPYLDGMPEHLIEKLPEKEVEPEQKKPWKSSRSRSIEKESLHRGFKEMKENSQKKGILADTQREELEDILRNLTPERSKISEAMVYCIEHADAASEVVDCIAESLAILDTPLHKKIARLYLISDILHNCCVKVSNASFYRKGFQSRLTNIFLDIHNCFSAIEGRLKAEQFKHRVMNCFKAWEDWAIYTSDFLIKLQNIFLGLNPRDISTERKAVDSKDIDGEPVEESDIDGIPIDNTIDGTPFESTINISTTKFKPSKWETVDPDLVESQAMTTSKWESLESYRDDGPTSGGAGDCDDEDIDGKPMDDSPYNNVKQSFMSGTVDRATGLVDSLKHEIVSENDERRVKLREIEVRVLKFQDELESRSRKSKKSNQSIESQIDEYRSKLVQKYLKEQDGASRSRSRSSSSSKSHSPRSHSRSRSHSNSPRIRSSRSPSSHHSYHHDRRQRNSKISKSRSRSRSPLKGRRGSSREEKGYHSRSPRRRSRSPRRSKRR